MQRIQAFRLLTVCVLLSAVGCSQEKVLTVAEYMHDMDSTKSMLELYKSDRAKYQSDTRTLNASAAWAEYSKAKEFDRPLSKCWSSKPPTTAGTDHACLDNNGFKR